MLKNRYFGLVVLKYNCKDIQLTSLLAKLACLCFCFSCFLFLPVFIARVHSQANLCFRNDLEEIFIQNENSTVDK